MRICQNCGKKIRQGERCSCYQPYKKRKDETVDFYSSASWKRVAKAAKQRCGYIDEYALAYENKMLPGTTVHHIYPLKERPELALSLDNLVVVSSRTHKKIHTAYEQGGDVRGCMMGRLLSIRTGGV